MTGPSGTVEADQQPDAAGSVSCLGASDADGAIGLGQDLLRDGAYEHIVLAPDALTEYDQLCPESLGPIKDLLCRGTYGDFGRHLPAWKGCANSFDRRVGESS